MDAVRFDALARNLAASPSRRVALQALATLLAALAGLLHLPGAATPEAAARKKRCRRLGKRCGGKHRGRCCGKLTCRGRRCKCPRQKKACQGRCIPKAHCCSDADCGGGATCQNGICDCPDGEKPCQGTCIPEGDCCQDSDCGPCQICQDGACLGCDVGQECLAEECVCTTTSCPGCCEETTCLPGDTEEFCGAGGLECLECGANEECSPQGECVCAATLCGAECVDLQTNDQHCGDCDNACAGTATCQAGACAAGGSYRFVRQWDGLPDGSQFTQPLGVAVDVTGNVYVSDAAGNDVQKFTADGDFLDLWSPILTTPFGLDVSWTSGETYVAVFGTDEIQPFASDGTPGTAWNTLDSPFDVAVNQTNGEVYVAIGAPDNAIQRFSAAGVLIETWASDPPDYEFSDPIGIAVGPNGDVVYVTNGDFCEILKFTAAGVFLDAWGREGNGIAQFDNPAGIAVDQAGDVYVADSANCRIQKFTADGGFIGAFGEEGDLPGDFAFPWGVAVARSGKLYVAASG